MGDSVGLPKGFEVVEQDDSELPSGFAVQQGLPPSQEDWSGGYEIRSMEIKDPKTGEKVMREYKFPTNAKALPFMDSPPETDTLGTQMGSATNEAIAGIAGLPMDMSRGVANMLGADIPTDSWGGSEYIRNQLTDTGFIQPESNDPLLQGTRSATRMATEAVLPMGYATKFVKNVRSPVLTEALEAVINNPMKTLGLEGFSGAVSGIAGQVAKGITDNPYIIAGAELLGGVGGSFAGGKSYVKQGTVDTIKDFEHIGATPTAGQALNSPEVSVVENLSKSAPFVGDAYYNAAQKTKTAIQRSIEDSLDDIGGVKSREATGAIVQKGFRTGGVTDRANPDFDFDKLGYIERQTVRANDLYSEADRLLPDGYKVTLPNTEAAAKKITKAWEGAPTVSARQQSTAVNQKAADILADLEKYSGFMPYKTMREIRSNIGEVMSELNTSQKTQYKKLYTALSKDMDGATEMMSPAAQQAAKKANNHWRRYNQRIDDYLKPLLDKKDPSHISSFLNRSGKQGAEQLKAVRRSLKPEEWNAYVSHQLDGLGKSIASQQDDIGSEFSTETFLTNWNKLPAETKTVLFSGNPKMRVDFDIIARVTSKIRGSEKFLANASGSGKFNLKSGGGLGALALFDVWTAGLGAATLYGNRLLSVAMTSPKTMDWLAKGVKLNPARVAGHLTRLATIAQQGSREDKLAALEMINILSPTEDE